ncbi:DJ-1/PfpI family protein [Salinimonas lutimaris]|uniref:DJ-1/PfpI family protein n=1 Tax=Salinimonas lutimaris TaxID=914153 RepID=UPI0010C0AABD|nr:DJ-1/PfpI family protein [Salinimonas lutimaris]
MNIGIYIYPEAEVLDFAGPFEVFSTARRLACPDWQVYLIAQQLMSVSARGNFPVVPHFDIHSHPALDVLIVAGGVHTDEMYNPEVLAWLKAQNNQVPLMAAVCTGVFILASAGLLTNQQVTTHWQDTAELASLFPALQVKQHVRWITDGKVTTSGGISAGIDMSLQLVSHLTSIETARQIARQMEYQWVEQAD